MSTEQDVAPNTQIDSAPDSAPDSPTYTREQVEAREKQARDTAWAEARRAFKADRSNGKQPDKQEAPAKVDNGGGGDALTRALRQRDALDDALAGRPITAEQRRFMRDQMKSADPDVPDDWAKAFVSMFIGGSPGTEPTPINKPASGEVVLGPRNPPQSDGGAPQGLPVWERPSDPFKWSAEDVTRLVAQKGPRDAHRLIRRKAEEYARNIRLAVPTGRREG